jgi:carbon-monoxide dehydrogenase large subunit
MRADLQRSRPPPAAAERAMMSADGLTGTGIGQPVRRKEDARLLTGKGRFSDDLSLPGQAIAYVLRSPHAHARIHAITTSEASKARGVVAVFTHVDLAADSVGNIPGDFKTRNPTAAREATPEPPLVNRDGSDIPDSPFPLLARDRVRFVGQAVAFVVAETLEAAKDAAELIDVDYETLEAVAGTRAAAEPGAPRLWDHMASNVCLDAEFGNASATDAAFRRAHHVTRFSTHVSRVTGVPMEPRAAVGVWDLETGRITLHAGSGGVVRQKRELAEILGLPQESVRVVAHDIGGNFGTKNSFYPEFALVCWASRRLGRPVKWTAERSECFLSDYQGRDMAFDAEIALDKEGRILAVRSENLSNLGAYAATMVPLRKGMTLMNGVYAIPAVHVRGRAVLSNTMPTTPYRSAGRPEAMYVIERLIDLAAAETGHDPIALRRKNLIQPAQLPYDNGLGLTYDSGLYEKVMDEALALGDWAGFPARKEEARTRGKLRGIGFANYIEVTMGAPIERAELIVRPEGVVDVVVGTLSSGQGHETSFTQCVSDWLGVSHGNVRLVQGDTDIVKAGGGSHSGRSMRMAGFVMGRASEAVVAKAKRIAAVVLEAAPDAIDYSNGMFTARGTNRSAHLFELAAAAVSRSDLPDDLTGPLQAAHQEHFRQAAFPYGAHVCEVEIDPDTGVVALAGYAAVDDVGRAINPLILHGQAHGGIVQGVSQILWEHCCYDVETAQLLSATFMDYAMPRADVLPRFATGISEVPAPGNPLGIRAGGEGGTTPALAVVVNAIVNSLSEFGIRHIEMPATPERVWRAIHDAKANL